jgi:hypothetical protein
MTETPAPTRPVRRTRITLILTGTFVLGMLAGVGLAPLLRRPPPHLPPSLQALHLRPEQRARIEAIVIHHGPEVEAALGDALPRLRAVQDRVALEIEAELDPDQRERLRHERLERMPPIPPLPPPMPH